jgi:hypothetical protein
MAKRSSKARLPWKARQGAAQVVLEAWADSESDKCVLREAPLQIVRALATPTHTLRRPEPIAAPCSTSRLLDSSSAAIALRCASPALQRTPPAPPRWIRTERTSPANAPAGPDRRRGLTSRIVKDCIQELIPKTRKSFHYLDYASITMNNLFFRGRPRSV